MDIKRVASSSLDNYDQNVEKYIRTLREINCDLIYAGRGVRDCIFNRTVYGCSIRFTRKRGRRRVLDNVLPIMIGSKVDVAVRKMGKFELNDLTGVENLSRGDHDFDATDVALTCFVINGALKQIPFFVTNDNRNPHVLKDGVVRMYKYDEDERGSEICFDPRTGKVEVKRNDGTLEETAEYLFGPRPVDVEAYFDHVFRSGFEIDSLANRIVISPGHLFYKLFRKYLYVPLKRDQDVVARHKVVARSVVQGDLLHVISKKTVFYKEHSTRNKTTGDGQQREIGCNGEVFVERRSTPYRDVNTQYYPLFAYLSHFANLQISSKVKSSKVLAFNGSYTGFLCIYGTSEAKNVGRVMMLARDTFVSTREDPVPLDLRPGHYGWVVVNSACFAVDEESYRGVNLARIKAEHAFVECYETDDRFIFVTRRAGMLFKRLEEGLWVTAGDIRYWTRWMYGRSDMKWLVDMKGYDFLTSHLVDFIPYHRYNNFPKNILALNSLKNGVFSNVADHSLHFCETVSAYVPLTEHHRTVLEPVDDFSKRFLLRAPRLNLMYSSFEGKTQEDCIVAREDLGAFDLHRRFTVKIKLLGEANKYFFPGAGSFLGTLSCERAPIRIASQTMHLRLEWHDTRSVDVHFTKPGFEIVGHVVKPGYLFVMLDAFHKSGNADKLTSFSGQKGVLLYVPRLPRAGETKIDLIVNPYCIISRQTAGQIREAVDAGGRDESPLINSNGQLMEGSAFVGPVFYFPILYLASEHFYLACDCAHDLITGQPVRGRSRKGGMRIGQMELFNGLQGNGLASCFEEIMLENSDRTTGDDDVPLPLSANLCRQDAQFFKCDITHESEPPVQETTPASYFCKSSLFEGD